MLFTDPFFLRVFFPVTFFGSLLALWLRPSLLRPLLAAASLYFYACFNPVYLALLGGSIAANFWLAGRILARPDLGRRLLILGVGGNLALLGYFKYLGFFSGLVSGVMGLGLQPLQIVLPLGISFFSFTQLAYLVDCQRGIVDRAHHSLLDYILFVTFFPHLVAGPILHHAEMMPQFDARPTATERVLMMGEGALMFAIGLFKKVVIADSTAPLADQAFGLADGGTALNMGSAWLGTLAYTLQIYFDFSGYSDMAIGLGLMFAVRLPWNFDSPYMSSNITQFWRRWHMTLSRWLRDYLYISLGGNRHGSLRRYRNLFLTMVLGGLWHGAALNFVIWGALHGAFLVIHNLWMALMARSKGESRAEVSGPAALASWGATMLAVMVAWVFFRASTPEGALAMLQAMAGFGQADAAGVDLGQGQAVVMVLAAALAMLAPNSRQISAWLLPALEGGLRSGLIRLGLGFGTGLAVVTALIAALRVTQSPFLYFNF